MKTGEIMNSLLVEAERQWDDCFVIRAWKNVNPLSVMMEQLPEVTWKIQNVFNELIDLLKDIPRQYIESIFWVLLVAYAKEL